MEQENEYQIRNKESQKTIYKKYTQEPSKFMTLALLWVKFRIAYRGYFFKILRFKCVCVCVRELNRVYLGNTNNVIPDPVNNNGEITHLEPDILECKVKWALESITTNKASGGDGIPVELFQILKDDAVKVLHYASNFGKLSSGHRSGKISFHSNPKERQCQRMLKLLHNCTHLTH